MITALIGHRGVGKTNLLRRLESVFSAHEDVVFKDLDLEIEVFERRPLTAIFKESGEKAFREMERKAFFRLIEDYQTRDRVFIAIGAGFEFEIPEGIHCVWIRRVSDVDGRIFLSRPRLNDNLPLQEWKVRYTERDPRYKKIAHEELFIPEGSLHDTLLEEHFFTAAPKLVPYYLTALPENFKALNFFEKRKAWGLKAIEARDDLLSQAHIQHLRKLFPPNKILFSARDSSLIPSIPTDLPLDWALELGAPPSRARVVSLHDRAGNFVDTFNKFPQDKNLILKASPEVRSFFELKMGHEWWKQDPSQRAFLPRSPSGRWQWYRQLFGPLMPIHYFREGNGTALDQPFLWQALATPKLTNAFAAVLGHPVKNSWTPTFQREFFDPFGIPVVAIDINEDEWEFAMSFLMSIGLRFAAVTSPLKKLAYALSQTRSDEATKFESVNTLALAPNGWAGHNTDFVGASILLKNAFASQNIPTLVWGGGGTKRILEENLPKARFISAREGEKLSEPINLVWAVGRGREFVHPSPPLFIQSVVDLNYSDNSPGKEIAQRAGSPYKSGELMFIHQGLAQREFWKRYF